MELRLEPKNSRAPNPYGSFPWQLGEAILQTSWVLAILYRFKSSWVRQARFETYHKLLGTGPETEMCGRKAGDFIDITITSCPPEVSL